MILQLTPHAPMLAADAATAVWALHIGGAGVGLTAAGVALAAEKGGRLHRLAGNTFFAAMLTMSAIGAASAWFPPQISAGLMSVFTFYLVATGWATVIRRQSGVGAFEYGALFASIGVGLANLALGWQGANSAAGEAGGASYQVSYALAAIAGLFAILDLGVILRGGVSGSQRIARHVWRMSTALFVAAVSFFLGQHQVFPAPMQGAPVLFAPGVVVLGLMAFWLFGLRAPTRSKARPKKITAMLAS